MAKKKKRLAVVTGASAGLGREFARQLVAQGYRVLAVARRAERLEELAEETGGHVVALPLDLIEDGAPERVYERARELGPTTLLVNNAGFGSYGAFIDEDWDTVRSMMRLNMEALTELTYRFLPQMIERDSGGIINIASTAAFQPLPYMSLYAATKAFVLSFSEGLAEELHDTHVHILASCPGSTRTEFHDVSGSGGLSPSWMQPEEVVAEALRAFDKGDVVRVHGTSNQAMIMLSRRAPKSWLRRFLGQRIRSRK